jgi:hypothetical protein
MEHRSVGGGIERLPDLTTELIRLGGELILAGGSEAMTAADTYAPKSGAHPAADKGTLSSVVEDA